MALVRRDWRRGAAYHELIATRPKPKETWPAVPQNCPPGRVMPLDQCVLHCASRPALPVNNFGTSKGSILKAVGITGQRPNPEAQSITFCDTTAVFSGAMISPAITCLYGSLASSIFTISVCPPQADATASISLASTT